MDDIYAIREAWFNVFGGKVPGDETCNTLLEEAGGDVEIVFEAIEVCSLKKNIISCNGRLAYIRGIIRNKTNTRGR